MYVIEIVKLYENVSFFGTISRFSINYDYLLPLANTYTLVVSGILNV